MKPSYCMSCKTITHFSKRLVLADKTNIDIYQLNNTDINFIVEGSDMGTKVCQ